MLIDLYQSIKWKYRQKSVYINSSLIIPYSSMAFLSDYKSSCSLTIRNIAFDSVDVPYADRAVSIYSWPSKNAGDIYDVYFKGYRVEEISYKTGNEFFGIKDSAQSATPPIVVGPLHDMYFQNTEVARISDYPTPQKLWLYGYNNDAKT